jgi:hypothetical protein
VLHMDKYYFDNKCEEVLSDIEEKKARSSAWIWIALGGLAGFTLSCIRFTNKKVAPILAGAKKEKEDISGQSHREPFKRKTGEGKM